MLTERQHRVLDVIKDWVDEKGYPPTVREIGDAMGIKSPNGVVAHLSPLVHKGFIVRGEQSSRSIFVTEAAKMLPKAGEVSHKGEPWQDRFWRQVDKRSEDLCWEWKRNRDPSGYGLFTFPDGKKAHRAAWVIANGPIPDGKFICHHCDNPPCVNPSHLFLGSCADNTRDMIQKGRAFWQKASIIDFQI